jgi:beta-glucosidase/6-phospho-beta-glucosidase/beta-galactosidase
MPVYVTEAGFPDDTGVIKDDTRVLFYKEYIDEVLKGIVLTTVSQRYVIHLQ